MSLQRISLVHPFFGMSFLAFKEAQIPVGAPVPVTLAQSVDVILERHYRASKEYAGFYNPLFTSDKTKRWVAPRYGSTSLQRITTDTFADALIHPKGSSLWGWQANYINMLYKHLEDKHMEGKRIPAFDLAVWLYRSLGWPDSVQPDDIITHFFASYSITEEERSILFDTIIPDMSASWMTESAITQEQLYHLIGAPPGAPPEKGAALRYLEMRFIGPSDLLRYEPKDRMNVITGDNSLGKTFLLETMWWALTGEWIDYPAIPKADVARHLPTIAFGITKPSGRKLDFNAGYLWPQQEWSIRKVTDETSGGTSGRSEKSRIEAIPGLVIYARNDGSFAVWDPASPMKVDTPHQSGKRHLFISRDQILDGVPIETGRGNHVSLCNGLIYDWNTWKYDKRYEASYEALKTCLRGLSPETDQPLTIGDPMRLPGDRRDLPTLEMPYGSVPIPLVSAGIRRIISIAYILVWAWHEHLANSLAARENPERRLVLLVDEVESHLHPKWQRAIVPALINVLTSLASEVSPQLHIASHSAMVLASLETLFDPERDALHHLHLKAGQADIEEIPFVRHGTSDVWLTSEIFGLRQARSIAAEQAIERANQLQLQNAVDDRDVQQANTELIRTLAADDEFWPMWRYFAKQHGVK